MGRGVLSYDGGLKAHSHLERPLESLGPAELAVFYFVVRRGFDPKPSAQTKHADPG